MTKIFDSNALKGASSEATREQADFLAAVIEFRREVETSSDSHEATEEIRMSTQAAQPSKDQSSH